jgi:hypothetical protein
MNTVPTLEKEIPENKFLKFWFYIPGHSPTFKTSNKDACTMLFKNCILTLIWALGTAVTASLAPVNSNLQFRSAFSHASAAKTVKRDTVFKNSTLLNKSWNGATLLRMYVFF